MDNDRSMSNDRSRTGAGWAWLLALPVLCCTGHAVLLAVSAGSLATVVGSATGSALPTVVGAVVLLAAVVVLVRRSRTW